MLKSYTNSINYSFFTNITYRQNEKKSLLRDMIIHSNGATETSITLQTRKGTEIPNTQINEYSAVELNSFPQIERNHPAAKFRKPPIPYYNCHGLTFASKRTGISDNQSLRTILDEDGYSEIKNIDEVLPGDIILYYTEDGDIEHSGVVVSEPDKHLKIPMVVSKWGKYKEVIHSANDSPYSWPNVKYYRVTRWI